MQVLHRGAESVVYLDEFEGQKVMVKERIPKRYRIRQLDDELRKTRTRKEVKLLTEVRKLGIPTPKIFNVDEENHKIAMEYLEGKTLKDYIDSASNSELEDVCRQLGKIIGKLHSSNITHGDLTTSNMIVVEGKIYLIDLSLGEFTQRLEDKGVDLKLLKESAKASHFKKIDLIWKNVLLGYMVEYKSAQQVLDQLSEIEKRVRYANRDNLNL